MEEKWIIGRLNELIDDVTENIAKYDLGIAIDNIYSFSWNEFCDWYIEMAKPRLNSENNEERENARLVLTYGLEVIMKLLHPFMPFVTTEIYSHLKNDEDADLMVSSWPEKLELDCEKDVDFVEKMKNVITKVRNIRTNMNVHPSKKVKLVFVSDKYQNELENLKPIILRLAFGTDLLIQNNMEGISNNDVSVNEED